MQALVPQSREEERDCKNAKLTQDVRGKPLKKG